MIPLLHDFTGATVLVFGGGTVGMRRARTFAREARVIVVSPTFATATVEDVELVRAAPAPADVEGWIDRVTPALVVAATDDGTVNAAIESAGRDRTLMVNRADRTDRQAPGDVAVPATARNGPVVVAVGTDGASPTLARYLRDAFDSELDQAGSMARLLADLRADLQEWPADRRRRALERVVSSDSVWKALGDGPANGRQKAEEVIASMGERS